MFSKLSRQQFRRFFQPSRILLGVFPAPTNSGVNIITLCFNMYCSYDPPMMGVAVHNVNESYNLIDKMQTFVLAVPGTSMLSETMFCGLNSMRDADKAKELSIGLQASESIDTPGLARAIANIELVKEAVVTTGDHKLLVGRVVKFGVNRGNHELPLLSIGPNQSGFKILAKSGIHRIGVVDVDKREK